MYHPNYFAKHTPRGPPPLSSCGQMSWPISNPVYLGAWAIGRISSFLPTLPPIPFVWREFAIGLARTPRPESPILQIGSDPSSRMRRFCRRNRIFGSELLAPQAFTWSKKFLMRNSSRNIYLDRNNAIDARFLSGSCDRFIASTVAAFGMLVQRLGTAVWNGRAQSMLSGAYFHTRSPLPPYEVERRSELIHLFALLYECLAMRD